MKNWKPLTDKQKYWIDKLKSTGWVAVDKEIWGEHTTIVLKRGDEKINLFPDGTDYQGLYIQLAIDGWWIDPAGGTHSPDDDDPAAMYE